MSTPAMAGRNSWETIRWLRRVVYREHPNDIAEAVRSMFVSIDHDKQPPGRWPSFARVPVPIDEILAHLNVRVRPITDITDDPMLATVDPGVIYLNQSAPLIDQRFAAAHHFGHLILHEHNESFTQRAWVDPSKPREPKVMTPHTYDGDDALDVEREANTFASHLLMPMWLLEPIVTLGGRSTDEVAALFQVPPNALRWQLGRLR